MRVCLAVALACLASTVDAYGYNATLTLLTDKEAVCSQGNQAGYYTYMSPTPSDNWLVVMYNPGDGTLWCLPPGRVNITTSLGNCQMSAQKEGTTPKPLAPIWNAPWDTGIYSNNCTSNPTFCNFNKVVLQSCDAMNWMGNTDKKVNGSNLFLRGQRILSSSISQIAQDMKFSAKSVIAMSGTDGGAHALFHYADRIGAQLKAVAGVTNYRVIFVDGLYPRWSGYFSKDTFGMWYGGNTSTTGIAGLPDIGVYEYGNCSGAVRPECLKTKPAGHEWECMISTEGFALVESKMFVFAQAWGTFGSFCLVNAEYFFDPNWDGWHVQCDPHTKSLHECVEYGWQCSQAYLDEFVNPYIEEITKVFNSGPLSRAGNGGYAHSCHLGSEDIGGPFFDTILIDGVTPQKAVDDWWASTSLTTAASTAEVAVVDNKLYQPCLWNSTYTVPFKNCCNPSCPNIAYMKEKAAERNQKRVN